MRIGVITARYSVSGVPLAQLRLAEAWRRRGAEVDTLFGYVPVGKTPANPLDQIDLQTPRTFRLLPKLVRYFRQRQPDIVFSAEDHLNVIVLLAAVISGSRAKICCSSRVTPFDTYVKGGFPKRTMLKWMMKAVMWRADLLTCVSRDMVGQYREIFGDCKHVCVYNIVDRRFVQHMIRAPVAHAWLDDPEIKVVVAAGSLEPWKGFADLIKSMTIVQQRARLLVLGEGSQRQMLERLIGDLGLSERVGLVGQVANPLAYFSRSHVFALSSRVEGMPNVLVEAMMCGCTPVAMDCPTGPRELLADSRHGRLVPVGDWRAMGAAINDALDQPAPIEWIEKVIEPFSEEAVFARYMQLLGLDDREIRPRSSASAQSAGVWQ